MTRSARSSAVGRRVRDSYIQSVVHSLTPGLPREYDSTGSPPITAFCTCKSTTMGVLDGVIFKQGRIPGARITQAAPRVHPQLLETTRTAR